MREAIARLSIRAAECIGRRDSEEIKKALRADLVVFDPDSIVHDASFGDPARPAPSIEWVIVGGRITVDTNSLTGSSGGRVARRRVR